LAGGFVGRKKSWIEKDFSDGVVTIEFSSWKYFSSYIQNEMLDYKTYIYRGQRCDYWRLEPKLDRLLKSKDRKEANETLIALLEKFKYASRGRRGTNPAELMGENDWWSLGQHYGLATPLLDWTSSPFVAAYFAFIDEGDNDSRYRVIYAIGKDSIAQKSRILIEDGKPEAAISFVSPLQNENARLVNQSGLFSRAPLGVCIEEWVREQYKGEDNSYILMKFLIPDLERELCLRYLNRMNVNHLTLFPDLYGASKFCNIELLIEKY